MGQVALGFRSLLIKGSLFFVMAALLAWALGGTLWPRPEIADLPSVSFDGSDWFWRLSVGGPVAEGEQAERTTDRLSWTLMRRTAAGPPVPVTGRRWVEVAGPVVAPGAAPAALYYAGRESFDAGSPWHLERLEPSDGGAPRRAVSEELPDRLAVERRLARKRAADE